jgi:hypothetical protein
MKKLAAAAVVALAFTTAGPTEAAKKRPGPPGPGSKQCSPGQNNVGGGPGNSGVGDLLGGAPLKPPPSCPGPDH